MIQTTYYSAKGITEISKLVIEYRKVLAIDKLTTEVERQQLISESIQAYSLLIKSDVQSLMHMYFKSAYENLHYALTASGKNKDEYLRQAKARFIDATTIEKNENLILSYIGLAFCQACTEDTENCTITLNKIKDVTCVLPNDLEGLELNKDIKDAILFYYKFVLKSMWCHDDFERTFEKVYKYYYIPLYNCSSDGSYIEYLEQRKEYYKRFLLTIRSCGGFSLDEKKGTEILTRAVRKILQEDFESFKSNVISQFESQQ